MGYLHGPACISCSRSRRQDVTGSVLGLQATVARRQKTVRGARAQGYNGDAGVSCRFSRQPKAVRQRSC